MFRVVNKETKEEFLMQESTIGYRLYSLTDGTGNGDFDISKEEFEKKYEVLGEIED